jgi:cysteine desulfuration protein SufE
MSHALIDARVAALAEDFDLFESWEDRIAYVIDLGRGLPPLHEAERTEATKVRGCASQVWLVSEPSPDHDGALRFRGQSDAAIVQGLIAVLIRIFSNAPPADILAADPNAILERLGLAGALTAQRANGLAAMIKRMRAQAAET